MNSLRIFQTALKIRQCTPAFASQYRFLAQKVTPQTVTTNKTSSGADTEIINEPVNYFGSPAASWSAKDTRTGGAGEELWYQPLVISISLAVFLLYFCMLREESDIDQKLEGSLFDHVPALEEVQLTMTYKQNKEHGHDNREVIKRLTEMGIDIKQLDLQMKQGN